MSDQSAQIQALQEQIARLQALVEQPRPSVSPPVEGLAFKVKIGEPSFFDGTDRKEATKFLSHLKLNFASSPASFATDLSKILYAGSWLRGNAFDWFQPRLDSGEIMNITWSQFETGFLYSFGDPDHKQNVTRELQRIRQSDSVSSYATHFFQLSTQLEWNDEALRAQFYEGLRDDVKDALALCDRDAKTVHDLANLALRLDNRLAERRSQGRQRGTGAFDRRPYAQASNTPRQRC